MPRRLSESAPNARRTCPLMIGWTHPPRQSSSSFRDAFADGFDVVSAPTTARNWWNQFISGEFNGDFQADLIDVSFANDEEEGREEEGDDDGA